MPVSRIVSLNVNSWFSSCLVEGRWGLFHGANPRTLVSTIKSSLQFTSCLRWQDSSHEYINYDHLESGLKKQLVDFTVSLTLASPRNDRQHDNKSSLLILNVVVASVLTTNRLISRLFCYVSDAVLH